MVSPFLACIHLPYLQQNAADPPTGRSLREWNAPRFHSCCSTSLSMAQSLLSSCGCALQFSSILHQPSLFHIDSRSPYKTELHRVNHSTRHCSLKKEEKGYPPNTRVSLLITQSYSFRTPRAQPLCLCLSNNSEKVEA